MTRLWVRLADGRVKSGDYDEIELSRRKKLLDDNPPPNLKDWGVGDPPPTPAEIGSDCPTCDGGGAVSVQCSGCHDGCRRCGDAGIAGERPCPDCLGTDGGGKR